MSCARWEQHRLRTTYLFERCLKMLLDYYEQQYFYRFFSLFFLIAFSLFFNQSLLYLRLSIREISRVSFFALLLFFTLLYNTQRIKIMLFSYLFFATQKRIFFSLFLLIKIHKYTFIICNFLSPNDANTSM